MNNLTIINNNGTQVVDSREVAEMVGKPHNDLMKSIRTYCEYLGQGNFSQSDFFIESTYQNIQNKTQPCYLLTKKGCDMVANKMTGEKGVLFTAAYVTAFEQMREALQPKLPQTYLEALEALVQSEKVKQEQTKQLEAQKPKVAFFDSVAESKTAIEMGAVAKVLGIKGMGRNNLFQFLRDRKVLMQNNQPMQTYVDRGYFRVIETKYTKPNGDTAINIKTLVYQKGVDFIRKMVEQVMDTEEG